jgi:hypothetical protein
LICVGWREHWEARRLRAISMAHDAKYQQYLTMSQHIKAGFEHDKKRLVQLREQASLLRNGIIPDGEEFATEAQLFGDNKEAREHFLPRRAQLLEGTIRVHEAMLVAQERRLETVTALVEKYDRARKRPAAPLPLKPRDVDWVDLMSH